MFAGRNYAPLEVSPPVKTVQHTITKEISRVSDDEALRLVTKGNFTYVPKEVWKENQK